MQVPKSLERNRGFMRFLIEKLQTLHTGITDGILDSKLMIFLFLVWNYGFLQGFFEQKQFQRKITFTIRCERRYWSAVVKNFAVFNDDGAVVLDLAWGRKQFQSNFASCNDEVVFLRCDNIYADKEKLASENLRLVLEAENQRVLPCFLVEIMLPEIGLTTDSLLVDVSGADLSMKVEGEKIQAQNIRYIDRFTTFISQNQAIAKNIEHKMEGDGVFEIQSHFQQLQLSGQLIAYYLAGKNYGEEFDTYKGSFQKILLEFAKKHEAGTDESDILEIFRLLVKQILVKQRVLERKKLPNFDFLDGNEFVLVDKTYYYFKRENLESVCRSELANMPFVRILRELDAQEQLKVTARGENNFTAVVNLITSTGINVRQKRLIAIKRSFFKEEE